MNQTPLPEGKEREAVQLTDGHGKGRLDQLRGAGLIQEQEGKYLLTSEGLNKLAAPVLREHPQELNTDRPRWDVTHRTLLWRGHTVLALDRIAEQIEAVLAAFETAGWPRRIDDPLESDAGTNSKERLRELVKRLNRKLRRSTLRFHADGTGLGIIWKEEG